MAKQYNHWTGFLEETTSKVNDERPTIDKAIRSCDRAVIEYEDIVGKKHTFFKNNVEEAKIWINNKKFPHEIARNVKIDGVIYKKEIR